jgi:hypothetical protein
VDVSINQNAEPDKRSYRVNFDRFERLAPDHQPLRNLEATVKGLIQGLTAIQFKDADYHQSDLIRLNVIRKLLSRAEMDQQLSLNYALS